MFVQVLVPFAVAKGSTTKRTPMRMETKRKERKRGKKIGGDKTGSMQARNHFVLR